jgi:hypothetical protein
VQKGTHPRFDLVSKTRLLRDTESQPIFGIVPGVHLSRRGPPLRRGNPISRAQLLAVRGLIPSARQMSL